MRLRSSQARSRIGVNRSGVVDIEAAGPNLLRGGSPRLVDLVDDAIELADDLHDLGESLLPLIAKLAEGGERRADIAHRIALSSRKRLRVALMAVGRMPFLDDAVDAVDQALDALGFLEAAFGTEIANPCRGARNVVAIGID